MKLKNLLLTWLAALTLYTAKGQDVKNNTSLHLVDNLNTELVSNSEDQKDTSDVAQNPISLTSWYAGQITWVTFDPANIENVKVFNTTRAWLWAAFDLTKNLSLNTWWLIDVSDNWKYVLGQAFLKQKIWENYAVSSWLLATPATLLRPKPLSGAGHFETWTDALIQWWKPWVRLDKKWKINWSVWLAAVPDESWDTAPQFWLNLWLADSANSKEITKKINIAWRYQDWDNLWLVLSWAYQAVSWTIVYNETMWKDNYWYKLWYAIDLPHEDALIALYWVQNWKENDLWDLDEYAEVWALAIWKVKLGDVPVDVVLWPWYIVKDKKITGYVQISTQF